MENYHQSLSKGGILAKIIILASMTLQVGKSLVWLRHTPILVYFYYAK
jgi:hypothetical protein